MLRSKMFYLFDVLWLFSYFLAGIHCQQIGSPEFESEWLLITAQTTKSVVAVNHGLGSVPGLVEVLVKAIDGPNAGFIFKAIGNGERDDDSVDMYGGILYIYNGVSVHVMAPLGNNQISAVGGAAIYTGEAPSWRGVNSQASYQAEIKVRCWSFKALPAPCFNVTNLYMRAGSPTASDTYKELTHNHTDYPSMVKVRVRLIDGQDPGWYSDAQGVALFNYAVMGRWYVTGGLKFAYNNETIRVWTSSHPEGAIFHRNDGWGYERVIYGISTTGYVEVFAWCDLAFSYEHTIPFGPSVPDEDLQVEAVDGPNKGYLFEVGGSAMPNTINLGQPCAYGGLVYAYNDTTLRLWRPDHPTGAAICIPDNMGFGTNSQASQNGNLLFRVIRPVTFVPTEEYLPHSLVCNHFTMLGNDTAYNSTTIGSQHDVATLLACDYTCRQNDACVTYSYHNDTCNLYNTTNDLLMYNKFDSQVWGLKARVISEEDGP